jgi:hypothetical protein
MTTTTITSPPPSRAIPMDIGTALRINHHMCQWYLHASDVLDTAPPPLTYTMAEMLEAAALARTHHQPGQAQVTIDDRGIAALYVVHHFPHSPNEAAGEPILKFPSPDGRAMRALLFLEFRS